MSITLVSDLGNKSPYVSWFESHIRHEFPESHINVLSHEIAPFKIIEAVYRWKCTLGRYPKGTIHISIYDTVLSFPQHILVRKYQDCYYLGVDNGMLTTTFDSVETTTNDIFCTKEVAADFSDFIKIICKTIYFLKTDSLENEYFLPFQPSVMYNFPKSIVHQNRIDCMIIDIDRHDNIITDLTYDVYESHLKDKNYIIKLFRNDSIRKITGSPRYDNKGELMAYFNDFGFMQISMSSKNYRTASLLGYHSYQKESFINSYITIDINE